MIRPLLMYLIPKGLALRLLCEIRSAGETRAASSACLTRWAAGLLRRLRAFLSGDQGYELCHGPSMLR